MKPELDAELRQLYKALVKVTVGLGIPRDLMHLCNALAAFLRANESSPERTE